MNQAAYLNQIGYTGLLQPTGDVLCALQQAHLYHVPFENLDITLGRSIRLEEDALFDKIVRRRRGGFCYELNGLFACLLESLGFRVRLLSASSANDDGSYSPEFDHLALEVWAPDEPETAWLVDVGWGDGFQLPLRIEQTGEQQHTGRVFRILAENDFRTVRERTSEGRWLTHYRFRLVHHPYEAFFPMCEYHQTSPDSIFTQKRICTLYTPTGRATLSERTLILTTDAGGLRGSGAREERALQGEEEVQQTLFDVFGIRL